MKKEENPLKKYYGKFTRTEKKLKQLPIIGFDSEDDGKGTVTLFCFFGDAGPMVTRFHKKAIDYIYSIETPTIFVAHNLEYDVVNLFKHDNYNQIEDMVYTGTRLLKMTLKGCPHTFVDSGAFFQGTVKALGKFVGKEKLEGNSQDEAYVTRDAEIPYLFLKGFQERLVTQEGVNLGMTIGQMSIEIYRRSYMLSKIQFTYNSPNCFKAYYGGRVEAFYLGTLESKCHVSDIRSCYPDVMRNELYPDTGTIVPSTIKTHKYGIGKFKMYVPESTFLPVLPHKESRSGRLFFPVGTFTGWWSYHEVRYAIECGAEIIEEYEGEGTNAGVAPFIDYIDYFYEKRLLAKAKGDQFDILLYKLFMNNLYGKFFQWRGGNKMTRDPIPVYKLEKYFEHPDFETKKVGPFYWYHLPKEEKPKHSNFMWGLYITSYARIKLHKALATVKKRGYTPVYCDTDSIMYTNLENKELPDPGLTISKKLGDWDKETFDLAIFRQAKAYILYKQDKETKQYIPDKWACKGVPTHYAHEFIIEAIARFEKPRRLKESLMRQNAEVNKNKPKDFIDELGANVWKDVSKEMRSIYIKRKGKKGITTPQNAKDLKELVKNSVALEKLDYLEEVKEFDLAKPEKPAPFIHPEISEDYFNEEPARDYKIPDIFPDKPFRLTFENMAGLKKDDIWFKGIPLRYIRQEKAMKIPVEEIPRGKTDKKYFTQILITEMRGEKMPENFIAEINSKIIDGFFDVKDFNKKPLAILLLENYVEKEYPKIGYII